MRHLIHSTFAPRQSMPSQQGSSPQALGRPPAGPPARWEHDQQTGNTQGVGATATRSPLPLTPHPPLPPRKPGERGRLPRPTHLKRSSHHPSHRKWERGGEAGVRGTPCAHLHARAKDSRFSHFPSPPGPLSHGASLGRGGASGVPVAYTTNHTSHAPPSSPLPANGRGVAKPG